MHFFSRWKPSWGFIRAPRILVRAAIAVIALVITTLVTPDLIFSKRECCRRLALTNAGPWTGHVIPNRPSFTLTQRRPPDQARSLRDLLPELCYLAMLHSGSMCCTFGSSMYSNSKVCSSWARSTLTETWTGPRPWADGADMHTISFVDRLRRRGAGGESVGSPQTHPHGAAPQLPPLSPVL